MPASESWLAPDSVCEVTCHHVQDMCSTAYMHVLLAAINGTRPEQRAPVDSSRVTAAD